MSVNVQFRLIAGQETGHAQIFLLLSVKLYRFLLGLHGYLYVWFILGIHIALWQRTTFRPPMKSYSHWMPCPVPLVMRCLCRTRPEVSPPAILTDAECFEVNALAKRILFKRHLEQIPILWPGISLNRFDCIFISKAGATIHITFGGKVPPDHLHSEWPKPPPSLLPFTPVVFDGEESPDPARGKRVSSILLNVAALHSSWTFRLYTSRSQNEYFIGSAHPDVCTGTERKTPQCITRHNLNISDAINPATRYNPSFTSGSEWCQVCSRRVGAMHFPYCHFSKWNQWQALQ